MVDQKTLETATLAGGCFWCTEAIFKRLKGVVSVVPGYTGGNIPNPSYEEVCAGNTGHAEAIQIVLDPAQISYQKILEIFFHTHDPTTVNRQGNDVGTQYRSAVFFHNQGQEQVARLVLKQLEKERVFKSPIVTQIVPFTNFYEAESYHKNYYDKNASGSYCSFVITPKIQKLLKEFRKEVKTEYQHEE